MIIGATMIISERPNRRRGIISLTTRNGCSAKRSARNQSHRGVGAACRVVAAPAGEGPASADAIWDKDIAGTAHRLNVKRQLRIVFNFAPKARHLHID